MARAQPNQPGDAAAGDHAHDGPDYALVLRLLEQQLGLSLPATALQSSNVHKCIAERHLAEAYKVFFRDVEYNLPNQGDIDKVVHEAKENVLSGTALKIPMALPPPRGRLPRLAGERASERIQARVLVWSLRRQGAHSGEVPIKAGRYRQLEQLKCRSGIGLRVGA